MAKAVETSSTEAVDPASRWRPFLSFLLRKQPLSRESADDPLIFWGNRSADERPTFAALTDGAEWRYFLDAPDKSTAAQSDSPTLFAFFHRTLGVGGEIIALFVAVLLVSLAVPGIKPVEKPSDAGAPLNRPPPTGEFPAQDPAQTQVPARRPNLNLDRLPNRGAPPNSAPPDAGAPPNRLDSRTIEPQPLDKVPPAPVRRE